eukprot:TRINITY_DN603942_c0_g2_i1.p1 TRINITY_DN603942_c0_g2~~TRINITY_DN603942_c0_g2_i1.p1  ORF type:complete len:669 (+),score=199.69 TRINITY_DN603942_c0_g2_i1:63-2069(+)
MESRKKQLLELFPAVKRFLKGAASDRKCKPHVKQFWWLMRIIEGIYDQRYAEKSIEIGDVLDSQIQQKPKLQFGAFIWRYLKERMGLKAMAEQTLFDILATIQSLRKQRIEIDLFGKFLDHSYSEIDIRFFLELREKLQGICRAKFLRRWDSRSSTCNNSSPIKTRLVLRSIANHEARYKLKFKACISVARMLFGFDDVEQDESALGGMFLSLVFPTYETLPDPFETSRNEAPSPDPVSIDRIMFVAVMFFHECTLEDFRFQCVGYDVRRDAYDEEERRQANILPPRPYESPAVQRARSSNGSETPVSIFPSACSVDDNMSLMSIDLNRSAAPFLPKPHSNSNIQQPESRAPRGKAAHNILKRIRNNKNSTERKSPMAFTTTRRAHMAVTNMQELSFSTLLQSANIPRNSELSETKVKVSPSMMRTHEQEQQPESSPMGSQNSKLQQLNTTLPFKPTTPAKKPSTPLKKNSPSRNSNISSTPRPPLAPPPANLTHSPQESILESPAMPIEDPACQEDIPIEDGSSSTMIQEMKDMFSEHEQHLSSATESALKASRLVSQDIGTEDICNSITESYITTVDAEYLDLTALACAIEKDESPQGSSSFGSTIHWSEVDEFRDETRRILQEKDIDEDIIEEREDQNENDEDNIDAEEKVENRHNKRDASPNQD